MVSGSSEGGGLYISTGSTVRNCLVTGNSSGNNAGGVRLRGGAALENCTVVGNSTVVVGADQRGIPDPDCQLRRLENNPSLLRGVRRERRRKRALQQLLHVPLAGRRHEHGHHLADVRVRRLRVRPDQFRGGQLPSAVGQLAGHQHGTNQGWMAGATDIEGNPRIFDDHLVDMGADEARDGLDFGSLMAVPGADGGGVSSISGSAGTRCRRRSMPGASPNSAELHGTVEVEDGEARRTGASEPYARTQAAEARSDIQYNPAGALGSRFAAATGRGDHPVAFVTWFGAAAFCNWRSGRGSLSPISTIRPTADAALGNSGYRLPSEQEWQKAAAWDKASASFKAYDGSNALGPADGELPGERGCLGDQRGGDLPRGLLLGRLTHGLKDAAGNVWEWCHGFYASGSSPATDPHAARGGGYGNLPMDLRADNRTGFKPGDAMNSVGFRVMTTNNPNPECLPRKEVIMTKKSKPNCGGNHGGRGSFWLCSWPWGWGLAFGRGPQTRTTTDESDGGRDVGPAWTPKSAADAALENDADAVTNLQESALGTDPFFADTDRDGWADGADSNPVSRAHVDWGDPDFTQGADGPGCRPGVVARGLQAGRGMAACPPDLLHVPASESNEECSLETVVNRPPTNDRHDVHGVLRPFGRDALHGLAGCRRRSGRHQRVRLPANLMRPRRAFGRSPWRRIDPPRASLLRRESEATPDHKFMLTGTMTDLMPSRRANWDLRHDAGFGRASCACASASR